MFYKIEYECLSVDALPDLPPEDCGAENKNGMASEHPKGAVTQKQVIPTL